MIDKGKGVVVFAYNFIHRKTQDFIVRLFAEGIPIRSIVAADPVKLNIPASVNRTKIRHTGSVHPSKLARAMRIEYVVMPHTGEKIVNYLDTLKPEIGIISGARILKSPVISKFSKGVINFHPGLIPEARGLDALLWGIHENIPLGVTSHLIDHRVDAGHVLERRKIELYLDDTIYDLSERLYEVQLDMIINAVTLADEGRFIKTDYSKSKFNRKMPACQEKETINKLPVYLENFKAFSDV